MPLLKNKIVDSFLIIFFAVCFISAQVSVREYKIKAAFLFNFTHFVEWPANSFSTSQSPLVIGILGPNPFGNHLEELIAGESVEKHPLLIKHFSTTDEVDNCHILFINIKDKKTLLSTIEKLKGKNILTVSDVDQFSKLGGMIRLYTKDDKVNIEINLDATKEEDIVVSSKLLKLSEIVKTNK